MATVSSRGRSRGGGSGGGGGAPGGGNRDPNNPRRGSWRGGPPGSTNPFNGSKGTPPPGAGNGSSSPRPSINDHMSDIKQAADDLKSVNSKILKTDADVSAGTQGSNRELQAWVPDESAPNGTKVANGMTNGNTKTLDSDTFGVVDSSIPWDQFAVNEKLAGVTSTYQEEMYTTKLNRSGADYKKREKEAERLANEIMSKSTNNSHVAEERGLLVEDWAKEEEDRFSGVARAPNAYVPPGARRGGAPPKFQPPAKAKPTNGASTLTPEAFPSSTTGPMPGLPRQLSEAPPAPTSSAMQATKSAPKAATPEPASQVSALSNIAPTTGVLSPAPEIKQDGHLAGVMDSYKKFASTEKERLDAKKQSMAKLEMERSKADLMKFSTSFKVPVPMPKDILPILSKDSEKQKVIEAKALESSKLAKSPIPATPRAAQPIPSSSDAVKTNAAPFPKKIPMKIQEIPAFGTSKKPSEAPPSIPVPETASQNIPLGATSPTPSISSVTSTAAKLNLNPKASAFVFKPTATAFKPAESSAGSPALSAAKLPQAISPQPAASSSTIPGPKAANPFFKDQIPNRILSVNVRDDFCHWKHNKMVDPASVFPQWPYTGKKYQAGFLPPQMSGPFEEDSSSPHGGPAPMQGMPQGFQGYGYRFNQNGMPLQHMQGSPMFSPPQFSAQLPGQPMPPQGMQGPGIPNGMPMYFQNGMPPNGHFIQNVPQQQMHYGPNTPQRGPPNQGQGPGPQMFYHNQVSTPHQTPQMHNNLPFPAQPPNQQFPPPMGMQTGPNGGNFENGPPH
ncbi:hypothetical protein P7C73_g2160, partial [Tremellales sp. Uapishka_1]